jgi:hypothetical protein
MSIHFVTTTPAFVLPYCSPFSDYLALRGNQPGAIFITQQGNPVTREVFAAWLKQ